MSADATANFGLNLHISVTHDLMAAMIVGMILFLGFLAAYFVDKK